ncbi:MAG: hypothetical protein AAB371_01780, partial [Patescibacteria group bacterium]
MPTKNFQRHKRFLIGGFVFIIILALSFSIFYDVFAAPPVTAYTPGETLDPSCGPTDTNCTVYPPLSTTITTSTNIVMGTTTLSFATSTLVIDAANSRVGIGTTNPLSKLHLQDGTFLVDNPASPTLTGTYNTSGDANDVYISGKYAYVADAGSGLQIIDIKGIDVYALFAGNIGTNDITVLENIDVGNNLYARNGLNVGSGGILTDGRLSVSGVSYFGDNVGIGTTSPIALLSVAGTSFFSGTLTATSSVYLATMGGSVGIGTTTASGIFYVATGTTNALTVASSGNIGIGTTTPIGLFQIATGTITALANGFVGIGTTTPINQLTVAGDLGLLYDGTTRASINLGTTRYIHTIGSYTNFFAGLLSGNTD